MFGVGEPSFGSSRAHDERRQVDRRRRCPVRGQVRASSPRIASVRAIPGPRGLGRARSRPPTASSPPRDPRLTAVPAPREPQVLRRQDQGHVLGKALRAVRLGGSPNRTPLTTRASSGISRNDFSRALSERARRFRSERLTADSYVSRSNHHGHSVSTRRGPRSGAAPARTRFPTRPCPSTRR